MTTLERIEAMDRALQAEEEERRSRGMFSYAFSWGKPCLLSQRRGVINRVSNTFCELLDYPLSAKAQIKKAGWEQITHPDDLERTRDAASIARQEAAVNGHHVFEIDVRYRDGHDQWVPVTLTIHVLKSPDFDDLVAVVFVEKRG